MTQPHPDDPDADTVYHALENRGAWAPQNKQTNKKLQHVNRGALGTQPNICGRAFPANIVNPLRRPLTTPAEQLHLGCLTGLQKQLFPIN